MSKGKDPAFLFYPNDWIGGTMGMTFEEKGAYVELLMMQFNRGHMTIDMIGQTVGQLWVRLEDKFRMDEDGLWYNERLDFEVQKRKKYSESRRNNKNGVNQYTKNIGHTTSHMGNGNENTLSINTSENEIDLSQGQKHVEEMIVREMMKVWMKYFPTYQADESNDFPALLQIAYKIAKAKGWKKDEVVNGRLEHCVSSWDKIVQFVKNDDFYRKLELTTIDRKWTGLYQTMEAAKAKEESSNEPKQPKIKLR